MLIYDVGTFKKKYMNMLGKSKKLQEKGYNLRNDLHLSFSQFTIKPI